jgi:RimJ/RimL family protein N-acetyltransferase
LLPLCIATLDFHEQCLKYGLDDGRTLFVVDHDGHNVGGCGLHHFIWGPKDICWASWFFVAPEFRQPTVALSMLRGLFREARLRGFGRLYVETPANDPDYARVAAYLPRAGFTHEASVRDFYAPDVDQLIFLLKL